MTGSMRCFSGCMAAAFTAALLLAHPTVARADDGMGEQGATEGLAVEMPAQDEESSAQEGTAPATVGEGSSELTLTEEPASEPAAQDGQLANDGTDQQVDQQVSAEPTDLEQGLPEVQATADGLADEDADQLQDADQLPENKFAIEVGLSYGVVVDVAGGKSNNGTNVQLYRSNDTNAQRWELEEYGEGYYIVNVASGKVLDVAGGKAEKGTNVQLYQKNGSKAQLWLPELQENGGWVLRSLLGNNLVLDAAGGKKDNGTNLRLWTANGSKAQTYWFREVNPAMEAGARLIEDGAYVLMSAKNDSMVLDVTGGSQEKGANIQLYANNSSNAQRFYATYADGFYTFQSVTTGLALDVAKGSPLAGANVQLYTPNHTKAQQWKLVEVEPGVYQLVNRGTGLVLDIAGGKAAKGTNVQGYYANGTLAQAWLFVTTDVLADGCYTLVDPTTSRVLEVAGASLADGAYAQTYKSNGTFAQRFYLSSAGTNGAEFIIRSVNSSKALGVVDGELVQVSGEAIWTLSVTDQGLVFSDGSRYLSFGSDNHGYLTSLADARALRPVGTKLFTDGYYQLRLADGRVLDVKGQSTSAADVQLATGSSSSSQIWRVTLLSGNTYEIVNLKSGLPLGMNSAGVSRQMDYTGARRQWKIGWDRDNGGFALVNAEMGQELFLSSADDTTAGQRWLMVDKSLAPYRDRIAQVAEHFANHNAHGYSQRCRSYKGTEVITLSDGAQVTISSSDVDCSDLVRQCVNSVLGYDTITYMDTRNEDEVLLANGFQRIEYSADALQRGDILWHKGHTAVYLGDGKQAEACIDENGTIYGETRGDNNGEEVAINKTGPGSQWVYIYRCVG